jgi:hypothetical protein
MCSAEELDVSERVLGTRTLTERDAHGGRVLPIDRFRIDGDIPVFDARKTSIFILVRYDGSLTMAGAVSVEAIDTGICSTG